MLRDNLTCIDYSKISPNKTPKDFFDDFYNGNEKAKNPKRLYTILQISFDKILRILDNPQKLT